jgi:tRNA A-37 threonylcarbamoyl transferase component Bud32
MRSSHRPANTTRRPPPWWLIACAASYLAYFALIAWCEIHRPEPPGLIVRFEQDGMAAREVVPDSPAARAGIAAGDLLLAADAHPLRTRLDWLFVAANMDADRATPLRVRRGALTFETTLLLPRARADYWISPEGLTHAAVRISQLITLVVGLIVAFKRPRDGVAVAGAWLLATVAVFSVDLPYGMATAWRALPAPIGWALWLPYLCSLAIAAVMWTFFAIFPKPLFKAANAQTRATGAAETARGTRTRGWARARTDAGAWSASLAWALAWTPILVTLVWHARFAFAMVYAPRRDIAWSWWAPALLVMTAGYVIATLATLVTNYRRVSDVTERRRVRVLVTGMLVGLVSGLPIVLIFWSRSGVDLTHSLFGSPLFGVGTVLLLACPASFAYAILRHRLFDAGMVIRQGVQYALARRVLLSLVPALGVLLALDLLLHKDLSVGAVLQARGWAYLSVAAVALVARFRRDVWLERLDRRFFRERYDAQRLLRDVAHRSREAADLSDVASHVVASIERALHPTCAAILMRFPDASTFDVAALASETAFADADIASTGAGAVAACAVAPIPADSTIVGLLRLLGKPIDLGPDEAGRLVQDLPDAERAMLAQTPLDLLVPIAMHAEAGRSEALLALGPRRSEEPFSQEDHELLRAVADSLAMVLERTAIAVSHPSHPSINHVRECPSCGTCYDEEIAQCDADGDALIALTLPRRLADRYRLDRRMARGGMGTVYEAFDQSLDRRVAAKVLRPELLDRADAVKRFEREARLAAGLTHPHIVIVHDFGVTGTGSGFLVMERLEGCTLRERLRQARQLTPDAAVHILRGIASAVDFAHQRQLVHRDLKPENIFLVRGADAVTIDAPKVLDFGLARALALESSSSSDMLTQSGVLVGTPQYMPPEQLRGETAAPAWDLWALALIAYEMLTGTLPFAGRLGGAAANGHEAAIAESLDGPLACTRQAFARALAMDPAVRFASASALVTELERALRDPRSQESRRRAHSPALDSEP